MVIEWVQIPDFVSNSTDPSVLYPTSVLLACTLKNGLNTPVPVDPSGLKTSQNTPSNSAA